MNEKRIAYNSDDYISHLRSLLKGHTVNAPYDRDFLEYVRFVLNKKTTPYIIDVYILEGQMRVKIYEDRERENPREIT